MGRLEKDTVRMFKYIHLKDAYKLSDRNLIRHTCTYRQMKYILYDKPEDAEFINPCSLYKFRYMRFKDFNLLGLMISKIVEFVLIKGFIDVKNKLIQVSKHTNTMFSIYHQEKN